MIQYGVTHDETKCCGCGACAQACGVSAIRMIPNREGFQYPEVDSKACVECGRCSKVCPMENPPSGVIPEAAYAVMSRDDDVLMKSSSGGVFRLLADYVINRGGCVAGCVFDEEYRAVFRIAQRPGEIAPMQGSKYVSSNPTDIYAEIRNRLDQGQLVLFTGTPCQNAALLNFLHGKQENLITVDFLCHGMPSQKVLDSYISYLKKKYHGTVEEFSFRDKSIRGWGYTESFRINHAKHKRIGMTSPYLYGFSQGYFSRYSCYGCPFRGKRFTDLTAGDYWGVNKHHMMHKPEKGVSALTINSVSGREIFEAIRDKADCQQTRTEWIAEENASVMYSGINEVPRAREEIYQSLENNGWKETAKKYLICPHYWQKRIWHMIPSDIKNKIRKG